MWFALVGIDDNNNANGSFDGESSFGGSLDGNSSLDSNSSFADIYNATANNLPDMPMSMASAASALDEPDDYAGLYPTVRSSPGGARSPPQLFRSIFVQLYHKDSFLVNNYTFVEND